MKNKLPISAIIVGFNESQLLRGCLSSIDFCDDIHYTDLGSNDESLKIAAQYATQIHHHSRVAACEIVQSKVVKSAKNDWIIFIDPDERLDFKLQSFLVKYFLTITQMQNLGAVKFPWKFYFRNRPLTGTAWGGDNYKYFLVNKNRFSFKPIGHYGRHLNAGFEEIQIEFNNDRSNVLHHYWMNSYRSFFEKHKRYLKKEGIDRYNLGHRTSRGNVIKSLYKEFSYSFFKMNGYRDGFLGLFLSLFWAWYQYCSLFSLYKIQKKTSANFNKSINIS